jgi:hypothetical protein
MRVKDLAVFIRARHAIYERRKAGFPKPWTQDPILQRYRFCNVYRELDTVTKWIADYWRVKYKHRPDGWFAMVVARLINWPATLEMFNPIPWRAEDFTEVINLSRMHSAKTYGSAYIVSTNGAKQDKAEYLANEILTPIWEARDRLRWHADNTLEEWYAELRAFRGMGSFIAAQVIADYKFMLAKEPSDFWTFCAPGPGSKRGMNRVMERDVNAPMREKDFVFSIQRRQEELYPLLKDMPRISNQDLQNCLCEFDKYERVRLGEGRPRCTYPGV